MTKFLDLDAVAKEAEFVVKLNGNNHSLKLATVETFVTNMKEIEKLGMAPSAEAEFEAVVGIVMRSFPTIPENEIRALNVLQIKALSDFAMTANGEKTEVSKESTEGNEQRAS